MAVSCAKDIVELTGDITGTVKDYSSGNSISGCQITLSPGGVSYTTSNDGSFNFNSLEPGPYTLIFNRAGYEEYSHKISVITGETANCDILLKAKSSFSVSETTYDFGDLQVTKIFDCFNNSAENCSYTISNLPEWASVNKEKGTISAGSNDSFTINVDRDRIDVGEYSQNITISYSGASNTKGSVNILIKIKKVILTIPEVTISSMAYDITQNGFTIEGAIVGTGGSQIISYGHCWSTSPNPTVTQDKTDLGNRIETGTFASTATGLNTYTTYYVRAYATNAQGTAYSEQVSVTTQDVLNNKWDGTMAAAFAGGSGTSVDPYRIETGAQLVLMKNHADDDFILMNNIDLDNISWPAFDFSGTFDGNGFSILNLKVSKASDNLGLFGKLTGTVKNLTISGIDIQAPQNYNIGAIAGSIPHGGSIYNCTVEFRQGSKILGSNYVGGIVGTLGYNMYYDDDISILDCSVTSSTTEYMILGNSNVGGLAGYATEGINIAIDNSQISVNIKGDSNIGGILGGSEATTTVSQCSYSGDIAGNTNIGGLVGQVQYSTFGIITIDQCKSDININVADGVSGGLIGMSENYSIKVYGSYSTGTISVEKTNTENIGGLIGSWDGADGYMSYGLFLCYSCVTSNIVDFNGLGGNDSYSSIDAIDCASVFRQTGGDLNNCSAPCLNITDFLRSCYSEYADSYDFNRSWTWTGIVDGEQISVSCPKLTWEN